MIGSACGCCFVCGKSGHKHDFHNQAELRQALDLLRQYQAYRRDRTDDPNERVEMPDPREAGRAIDKAIIALEIVADSC